MLKIILLALISIPAFGGTMAPKKTYTITSQEQGEELQDQRGFGDKEPEVRMMNLMMVGGSGYEGMDMAQAKDLPAAMPHAHDGMPVSAPAIELTKSPAKAKVGANLYEFTVKDSKSLPKVEVYMTSMDMGTETPKVKEIRKGQFQVKANFSMQGPWAIKVITAQGEKIFDVQVGQ